MNNRIKANLDNDKNVVVFLLIFFIIAAAFFFINACSDSDSNSGPTPTPTAIPEPTPTPDPPLNYEIRFLEYSEAAGIVILEEGPHGVFSADVNNDGYEDLYITQCCDDLPDLLYINQGDGSFLEEGELRGLKKHGIEYSGTHGASFFDMDNDGDYDLLRSGTNAPDHLYENDGNGYFHDVSSAHGISQEVRQTRGVLAVDIDLDNDEDLYLVTLACIDSEDEFINKLLVNQGDGIFIEEAANRGVSDDTWNSAWNCFGAQGITFGDIENDNDMDIYVNRIDTGNRLFINDGEGYFTNEARLHSVGDNQIFSNGAEFADIDNDGDLDLLVQDFDDLSLLKFYLNDGNGYFQNASSDYNLFSQAYSGLVADFDNDGDLDYYVITRGNKVKLRMYANDGTGKFTLVSNCGADFVKDDARSAAALDYDNDGDLDIMVVAKRGTCNFLRNEANNNRFLEIKLIGPTGNAGAFGAVVRIYQTGHLGEKNYFRGMRHAVSAQGYLSQNSPIIHFGLGNITQVADIEVTFSNGQKVIRTGVERGSFITISANE